MNPCLLIPIYDHGETIEEVVASLEYVDLPCLVIDDGSGSSTRSALERVESRHAWVEVEHLDRNRGRGAALRWGYRLAASRGYTHAVQIDADGQHEPRDVPKLLDASRRAPGALVLGRPVFDDSAPALRLYGRKISQFWVWVETLSLAIEDPLCGFRCLPLRPTVELLERTPLGDRMDFDPEIAVRLVWQGLPVINVPTRVRYHEGGLSHFQPVIDSIRIARAHVRLVAGMLPRAPELLAHRPRGGLEVSTPR